MTIGVAPGDFRERGGLLGIPDVERWAKLPYEILILGETGTGKSVLAAHLHQLSGRGAFVEYSLAQLSEEMALSELFGHARGAFTSAVSDRVGHFEAARGGTLFLDELGDCLPRVQGMLLKVLESRRVQRLGENRTRDVDFRLVAATNKDLDQLVADGQFRADLLARFGDYILRLAPLRERREIILPLARQFLDAEAKVIGREKAPDLCEEVAHLLRLARWPYNIRGLRSACRYLVGNAGCTAYPGDLPPSLLAATGVAGIDEPIAERARRVLAEEGGIKTHAARRLGISRGHLYRLLKVSAK